MIDLARYSLPSVIAAPLPRTGRMLGWTAGTHSRSTVRLRSGKPQAHSEIDLAYTDPH